jgi:hypothetical protein
VAREKDFMKEKDEKKGANAEAKKKKCARQTRKRDEAGFFDPFFVLSFPNQNPHQRARAH